MRVCVMLPTYKRYRRLNRFLSSMVRTADSKDNLCVALCLHKGDTKSLDVAKRILKDIPLAITWENERAPDLGLFFNKAYDAARKRFPDACVSMFGDDMYFITRGWDTMVLDEIRKRDGVALVYGDDCFRQHGKNAVFFVTTPKIVKATGGRFMDDFKAEWIDRVWHSTARRCGFDVYLPQWKVRHEHTTRKPRRAWDSTFKRLYRVQHHQRTKNKMRARQCIARRVERFGLCQTA